MTDRTLQNFVNGKFTDASDAYCTSDVTDPSTGEVCAHAPVSGRQDVDAAMQAAASASRAGGRHRPERLLVDNQDRRCDRRRPHFELVEAETATPRWSP